MSSYRSTTGLAECPSWLQVNWLLSGFSKRKNKTIEKYHVFVAEDASLEEIPSSQKRQVAKPLDYFGLHYSSVSEIVKNCEGSIFKA